MSGASTLVAGNHTATAVDTSQDHQPNSLTQMPSVENCAFDEYRESVDGVGIAGITQ